jgi:hypothetical protein
LGRNGGNFFVRKPPATPRRPRVIVVVKSPPGAVTRADQGWAMRGSSFVPVLLALIFLSAVIAVLSFLTLGFVGAILGLALTLAAFIALQYLIWGWWLGPWIARREQLSDDARMPGDDQK